MTFTKLCPVELNLLGLPFEVDSGKMKLHVQQLLPNMELKIFRA